MNLKRNKKGFTLVELIVVLVIIGILMALVIPNLTGYIDRARMKNAEAEARSVYMAAMALAAERYPSETSTSTAAALNETELRNLAGIPTEGVISAINVLGGEITSTTFTYTNYDFTVTVTPEGTMTTDPA